MALPSSANRGLRVLALHGHRQSGEIFAKKTGALKKILTSLGVSFIHYPTAPHKLKDTNEEGEDVYSWFNWEPEDKWSEPDRYFGVEESVEHLKQQFLQYGPFDGVLGFSQGGVMLSILTGMRVLKEKSSCYDSTSQDPIAFDFAIFCATFAPPRPEYFLYTMKSNKCAPLATLHVYGTGDPLVKCEMSKKLATEFELQAATPETKETASETDIRNYKTTVMHLEHSGGHYVATNGEAKVTFRAFFAALAFHFPSTPHHDKRTI